MVTVHMIVGTLVVIAFVLLVIVNIFRLTGATFPWARKLSYAAAGLLIVQYVLGFGLLGDDHKITAWHYIIAVLAILPVGAEHALAANQASPKKGLMLTTLATAGTAALTIIAYAIGQSN
jgi:hypothetical protein